MNYPRYHLMTLGWYGERWWAGPLGYNHSDCSLQDREEALLYSFAVFENDLITEFNKTAESGIVSHYVSRCLSEVILL